MLKEQTTRNTNLLRYHQTDQKLMLKCLNPFWTLVAYMHPQKGHTEFVLETSK